MRLFGNRQQVIDHVARHQATRPPMVWQSDLMHPPAVDGERRHALGDQGPHVRVKGAVEAWGKATLPLPGPFPTANKTSTLSPE